MVVPNMHGEAGSQSSSVCDTVLHYAIHKMVESVKIWAVHGSAYTSESETLNNNFV
jgi:hypothetical protein